jgi:hypothetical protein
LRAVLLAPWSFRLAVAAWLLSVAVICEVALTTIALDSISLRVLESIAITLAAVSIGTGVFSLPGGGGRPPGAAGTGSRLGPLRVAASLVLALAALVATLIAGS